MIHRISSCVVMGLLPALLAACVASSPSNAPVPVPEPQLLQFAQQVQAFNANLNQSIATNAAGALATGVALGKAACGAASMNDGLFKAAVPAMALAGVDPTIGATEAGVMIGVNVSCAIIDNANPSAPITPQVAQAVAQAVAAVPQITSAVKAVNPAAAAAATPTT